MICKPFFPNVSINISNYLDFLTILYDFDLLIELCWCFPVSSCFLNWQTFLSNFILAKSVKPICSLPLSFFPVKLALYNRNLNKDKCLFFLFHIAKHTKSSLEEAVLKMLFLETAFRRVLKKYIEHKNTLRWHAWFKLFYYGLILL